jgi:hypothetical protein
MSAADSSLSKIFLDGAHHSAGSGVQSLSSFVGINGTSTTVHGARFLLMGFRMPSNESAAAGYSVTRAVNPQRRGPFVGGGIDSNRSTVYKKIIGNGPPNPAAPWREQARHRFHGEHAAAVVKTDVRDADAGASIAATFGASSPPTPAELRPPRATHRSQFRSRALRSIVGQPPERAGTRD